MKNKLLSIILAPLIIIGGFVLASVSSYTGYKLGQKNYFENFSRKEISLLGSTDMDFIETVGHIRRDLLGTTYIKTLFEVEIPKLNKTNNFEAKHLANLSWFVRCTSMVLCEYSSSNAKTLGLYLKSMGDSINNLLYIRKTTTVKYLIELLNETGSLLKQATQIIDNELSKKTE